MNTDGNQHPPRGGCFFVAQRSVLFDPFKEEIGKAPEHPAHQKITSPDRDQRACNLQIPAQPKELDAFPKAVEGRIGEQNHDQDELASADLTGAPLVFFAEVALGVFVIPAL